jgi:hypothetical protein
MHRRIELFIDKDAQHAARVVTGHDAADGRS